MPKLLALICICVTTFASGCYRDNEQDIYGTANCVNPPVVTYSSTIKGILKDYGCLDCHSGRQSPYLLGYSYVEAKKDRILQVINHYPPYPPMPNDRPKMSPCDINHVKQWIDSGAPNN